MNMNPWLAEQLVPGRRAELERDAQRHGQPPAVMDRPPTRSRPALAQQVGLLLMAVGRRLAEPGTIPTAFEGQRGH